MTGRQRTRSVASAPVQRIIGVAIAAVVCAACSTGDGRQLADPDPDLTRVTTTAPTASGEAARGGPAAELAIPVSSDGPGGLMVSSPDFEPGAALPSEFTCDGSDETPSVSWSGNDETSALALVVRDADADGAVHWLVTDLRGPTGTVGGPAADRSDTTGTVRPNGFGVAGWTGPCPSDDLDHRYVFALYSLAEPLLLDLETDASTVVGAIEADETGAATTLATYTRS